MMSEVILLGIIFILALIIFISYKKLKYICSVLDYVLSGNYNQNSNKINQISKQLKTK